MSDDKLTDVVVTYTLGTTVNVGNFNNIKPEFTITARVPDGMSPTAAKDKLVRTVDSWMDKYLEDYGAKL